MRNYREHLILTCFFFLEKCRPFKQVIAFFYTFPFTVITLLHEVYIHYQQSVRAG